MRPLAETHPTLFGDDRLYAIRDKLLLRDLVQRNTLDKTFVRDSIEQIYLEKGIEKDGYQIAYMKNRLFQELGLNEGEK